VKIDLLSERLDDDHNNGHEFCVGFGQEVFEKSADGRRAKFPQELALALLKKYP